MDSLSFPFSLAGRKLTCRSGILELMDDLGRAMTVEPDMRMLGGGNPAAVPAMQALLRERMRELVDSGAGLDRTLGNYDPPRGNPLFLQALADLLQRTFGWPIGVENLAVTAGGQSAFFYLFNLLAGRFEDGRMRKVLLPLAPEYIGYADQGIEEGLFAACPAKITWPEGEGSHVFKYSVDFDAVVHALRTQDIACIAVSRPTNPSGNVITDAELARLSDLALEYGIPLILDNAYGAPFPNVIFSDAHPLWAPHIILTMSLSKLGLPGTRTAFVVGPPAITQAISAMTAVGGLANGNFGQQIALPWVRSGEILRFGPDILQPFYRQKLESAAAWTREIFDAHKVEWAIHAADGAFFQWLWLPKLSIPTRELYQRLKLRKVLVVPGEYFFFGLDAPWAHASQCLRLNVSQPEEVVRGALAVIAEEAGRIEN